MNAPSGHPERFEVSARLGLMFRMFKSDIEGKMLRQFDKLLAPAPGKPAAGTP